MTYQLPTLATTQRLAHRVAGDLYPGAIVALTGALGVGKSVFVRAAAARWGVTEPMPSPTFTLVYAYEGRVPIFHLDLYRLSGEDEFAMLGIEEEMEAGISFVEWADRAPELLERADVSVHLSVHGAEGRRCAITYRTPPPDGVHR